MPEGTLPVYQHWPGNWRPAEGTWDWAESVGLRAVATESQDHFEGPPTRPGLRKQFFSRDQQLHGTGELVSWTEGRAMAPMGLAAVVEGIEAAYEAFLAGSAGAPETEKRVCDLFMAARCGDYLDRLLNMIRTRPLTGWIGALARALHHELLLTDPVQLATRKFWRRSLLPELVHTMPRGQWPACRGYAVSPSLQFGALVLWSQGACGQVLREAIHVDWTDLVVEQGLLPTLVGRNALDAENRGFARWLARPLRWKCLSCGLGPTAKEALKAQLLDTLAERQPELGPTAWRVGPAHWARILEWVLIWRREITSPEMLHRAEALAARLLLDDSWVGLGARGNPIENIRHEHETPRVAGDIPVRLRVTVDWSHPQDFRLADEIYPAIAGMVAAWLRAAGHAACADDVFNKAPWLKQLIPARRLRMVMVLKEVAAYAREEADSIRIRGVNRDELEQRLLTRLGLSPEQFHEWLDCQAGGKETLEEFVDNLLRTQMFAVSLQQHLPERVLATGAALPAAIDKDLFWGLCCVGQHLRTKSVDFSSKPLQPVARVGKKLAPVSTA